MERHQNGRILRIKSGFNPNSSSVGSQIPMFLTFAAGTGALSVMVANFLHLHDRLIRRKSTEAEECDTDITPSAT